MSERDRNIIETLREGNRNLRNELNDAKARIAFLEEQVNRATMLIYSERAKELADCYLTDRATIRAELEAAKAELKKRDAFHVEAVTEYDRAIKALQAELAQARERERWIPVGERLPVINTNDLGEEYLVKLGGVYNIVCSMNFVDGEWFTGGWGTSRTRWNRVVTHWRPLPAPPEHEGE